MITIEELEESLDEILPNGFRIVTDRSGKIIIHTNLVEDDNGDLVPIDLDDDDDDEDDDLGDDEPEFEPLEEDDCDDE